MSARNVDDPLSLTGRWTFLRTIDDRLSGTQSTAEGHAELIAQDDRTVRWHESGTLFTGGQTLPVYRTLWIVNRDGGWFVTFDDGRDFHPWLPGEQVEHPCGPDLYIGRVDTPAGTDSSVEAVDQWTVRWDVTGPSKDYTMVTVLTA